VDSAPGEVNSVGAMPTMLSWLYVLGVALPTGTQVYEEPISDAAMISQHILPHLEMAGVEVTHGLSFIEVCGVADPSPSANMPCLSLPRLGIVGRVVAARRCTAGLVGYLSRAAPRRAACPPIGPPRRHMLHTPTANTQYSRQ
jgi:hypothetical protein